MSIPSPSAPLKGRRNLSEVVADELIRWIETGRLRVGELAPTELELTHLFAVGRSTAREAVRILVAEGLLDVRPGRGPIVLRTPEQVRRRLDPLGMSVLLEDQSLAHLYEFRLFMEVECAGRASRRHEPSDIEDLRSLLDAFRSTVELGLPSFEADVQFHLGVARASHNSVFVAALDAVSERLAEARAMTDAVPGARELAVVGHTEIFNTILRREPDAARSAMSEHILRGLAALEDAHGISLDWPGRSSDGS